MCTFDPDEHERKTRETIRELYRKFDEEIPEGAVAFMGDPQVEMVKQDDGSYVLVMTAVVLTLPDPAQPVDGDPSSSIPMLLDPH